jgi:hypothetical protein
MELLYRNSFLADCEQLSQLLEDSEFDVGSLLGRGFADLGYEVFVLLPQRKLCSLFTGTVTDFPEGDQHRFFLVPLVDNLIEKLALLGEEFRSASYDSDVGHWQLICGERDVGSQNKDLVHASAVLETETLHEALLAQVLVLAKMKIETDRVR